MAEFTTYPAGSPCWIDLQTSDLAKGVEFYTGLFGWEHTDLGEEAGHYGFFLKGGKMVAGVGPRMQESAPVAWNTYICVDDADATVAAATAAGGTVVAPVMDVMTAGRLAFFLDPTGGACGIWQPKDHKGSELANEADTWGWSELDTRDVGKAREFYGKVFGWTAQDFPEMGGYVVFKNKDKDIGGCMTMPDMVPKEVGAFWMTYFNVADADAKAKRIKELGGTVMVEPQDIPTIGRFAVAMDGQGGSFAIIKPNAMEG